MSFGEYFQALCHPLLLHNALQNGAKFFIRSHFKSFRRLFEHFNFVQIKNSENSLSNHSSFLRKIRMQLHKENGHNVLLFGHMVVIAKEVFYSRSKPLQ